jgi:hypothetical protein
MGALHEAIAFSDVDLSCSRYVLALESRAVVGIEQGEFQHGQPIRGARGNREKSVRIGPPEPCAMHSILI